MKKVKSRKKKRKKQRIQKRKVEKIEKKNSNLLSVNNDMMVVWSASIIIIYCMIVRTTLKSPRLYGKFSPGQRINMKEGCILRSKDSCITNSGENSSDSMSNRSTCDDEKKVKQKERIELNTIEYNRMKMVGEQK